MILLKQSVTGKSADDYVFTREGKAVLDFRGAWLALCVKAGVGEYVGKDERGKPIYEGWLFHDLRRSAGAEHGCGWNPRCAVHED